MVLVDSSVWIDYFNNGTPKDVDRLIENNLIVTNQIIRVELIPLYRSEI